jgi:RHS repeat-associated protein
VVTCVNADQTTVYVGRHYGKNTSTGEVTKYYAFGGQRVAVRNANGLLFLHSDHLGSASMVTHNGGGVVSQARYKPFGEVRWSGGAMPNNRKFNGNMDDGAGLLHYGAREYSALLGRFISADTIVPGAGNPQALNRYAYVLNRPLNMTDPSGHDPSNTSCNYAAIGCGGYGSAQDIKTRNAVASGTSWFYEVINPRWPLITKGVYRFMEDTAAIFELPLELLLSAFATESWGYLDLNGDPKSFGVSLLAQMYVNNPQDERLKDMLVEGINGQIMSIGPANIQIRRLMDARTTAAFVAAGLTPPNSVAGGAAMLLDVNGAITAMAAHLKGIANVRSANTASMSDVDMAFVRSGFWQGLDNPNNTWVGDLKAFATDMTPHNAERKFLPDMPIFRNFWNGN